MRIPNATCFLSQQIYKHWNLVRGHFAKRDEIRIHSRQPRRDAIEIRNSVSALSKLYVPTKH
jgi:hypothetical protein